MIYTIGHSTRSAGELIVLLNEAGVDLLVDVRTVPRSRYNPQFNTDALPSPLAEAGIGYRHMGVLGGLRHRAKGAGPSPNGGWRNAAFQAYADYALTPAFRAGLEELVGHGREHVPAVMCAEAVWWRCHRGLIADYLKAAGHEVMHIGGNGAVNPHPYTPAARIVDGRLSYEGDLRLDI
jgi:uncharacterized protein (DUF488 family)